MGADPVVAGSARKHGVTDDDMQHAFRHPIRIFELDEGLTMIIGAGHDGALLEIGVVESDSPPVIVHALPARPKFLR